jgi:hypothetical protein
MSFTKLSLGGNISYMTSLFPPRESLESDIPAGDSIFKSFFYGVVQVLSKELGKKCCIQRSNNCIENKSKREGSGKISSFLKKDFVWSLDFIPAI